MTGTLFRVDDDSGPFFRVFGCVFDEVDQHAGDPEYIDTDLGQVLRHLPEIRIDVLSLLPALRDLAALDRSLFFGDRALRERLIGMVNVNVEPFPTSLSAHISPW